jgi:chaperonin GroES
MSQNHRGPRFRGDAEFGFQDRTVRRPQLQRFDGHRSARYRSQVSAGAKQPITMLADRVLVQVPGAEGERKSRAGILIPATAQVSKRLAWAEVVAVGPHVRTIKQGDQVLFNPEDRYEVEVHGDEYLLMRERDIHAVASERLDGTTGLYL